MHHFSTSVAKKLSNRNEIQEVWAVALPKEAYSCDYLIHGLLALSAIHLSSFDREHRHDYMGLSIYHLNKSLAGFRKCLVDISTDNCVPLFAASSVMVIHVCAQSALERNPKATQGNLQSQIEMLMKLFNMCRGVETILAPYSEDIRGSSLRSLLHEDYSLVSSLSRYRQDELQIIL
jgi:hypothetical protein